ncbi:MAG TPA: hypothetical protein DCR46_00535 [Cytophagales bacterium]|nr:hypothetical protein [Cytophagales bacterium]
MFTKHLYLIFFLVMSFTQKGLACNGGCPAGGGYLGIVPQFSKNFVGLRYRVRSFESHNHDAANQSSLFQFQTAEVWGRFYPSKRIQAFVFLPFQMNSEKIAKGVNQVQNIGDISFVFNYNLLNTGDSVGCYWKHNLLLGIGAKLPTGKYQQRNESKQIYPLAFQPGTGAYSGIFSAIYTLRKGKIGFNSNATYYYNGQNELEYSFGNMLSLSGNMFYWMKWGNVSFLPSIGTYNEIAARDIDNGYYVNNTGGSLGYLSIGSDVYLNRLALGLTVQTPYLVQIPENAMKNDFRMIASATVLF